ncbi:MAG: hypothetical protein U9R68_01040 [Planctomycetota bacterium]|nr:hypothetical protein [Planctomycetota bacterium]
MVDESNRAAALAHRLRLVQGTVADEEPSAVQQRLSDEIAGALEEVDPPERRAFLMALMERFPTWDALVDVSAEAEAAEAAPSPPAPDEQALEDPDFLVSRLAALIPGLPGDRKNGVAQHLRDAGLALGEPTGWPRDAEQRFRDAILEGDAGPISPARVIDSLRLLLDFVCTLDPVVWHTWQAAAAKAETKASIRQSPGSVRTVFRRFLRQDETLPSTRPEEELEKLRRVVAALVCAIARGGQHFASRYWNELSPRAIERLVETETPHAFWGKDRLCWKKYCDVAGHLDENGMEDEVVRAFSECAIGLVDGLIG